VTETVTLAAGGGSFTGWKRVSWTAALGEAARSFSLDTTERPGEFAFPPGTPITLLASGTLIVTGYVNHYHSSGGATTHNVQVRGRGKGQDFIDCQSEHPTSHAKNKTAAEFGQELDEYGVGIRAKVPLAKIPMQHMKQGETCFNCLERYLRQQGATMMGEPDGSIAVTNASVARRAAGVLTEGGNIKDWSVDLNDGSRHSDYVVKGQNRHGKGASNLRIKERARDSGVRRRRKRIIVAEGDTDQGRARERANHEKERAAGASTRAAVTVQGWRDGSGALWTPNTLVFVNSPTLMHLVQDMLIERVEGIQDDRSGTIARLELVDPRAHRGKGQSGKGSAPSWNAGM
jgi:prophage tail gpP-like protein